MPAHCCVYAGNHIGMNFQNMPELATRYGYFVVLAVLIMLALSMLVYLRRKDII